MIVVFYHCVFRIGDKVLPAALPIVREQMAALKSSGLEEAADEIYIGVNGDMVNDLEGSALFPAKARVTYHGTKCRNELRTLLLMENWCQTHNDEAYILTFHSKGATHAPDSSYAVGMATPWRKRMMSFCVGQWRMCVAHLAKYDACGVHWLTGQGWDHSQHYFAGTMYWVRASFFRTIPSVMTRQRIKDSGIDALDSRYEAEVAIGNGPRLPMVKNYFSGGIGT